TIGEHYIDKDNVQYLPMSHQRVMTHSSTQESLLELLQNSLCNDVVITVYTEELHSRYKNADNRAVIAKHNSENLKRVGVGIRGKKQHVHKLFKGLALHS